MRFARAIDGTKVYINPFAVVSFYESFDGGEKVGIINTNIKTYTVKETCAEIKKALEKAVISAPVWAPDWGTLGSAET